MWAVSVTRHNHYKIVTRRILCTDALNMLEGTDSELACDLGCNVFLFLKQ